MLDETQYIRDKHLTLLKKMLATYESVLQSVDQTTATTYRDGAEGWTTLEILCHVTDFDRIFVDRGQRVLSEEKPTFTVYDVDAMAVERAYNQRSLKDAWADHQAARAELLAFFESVKDEQWSKTGMHPEQGEMTLLRVLIQVSHHSADHIEQITRVLRQA